MSQISECVDAVAAWMKSNRLQLNPAKTEVLWCATSRRHQLPTTAMLIDGVPVTPVQNVRDLGIYIDKFDIGRYELTSVVFKPVFFTMGVMNASLNTAGKQPSDMDLLNSSVMNGATKSPTCFNRDR